MTFGLELEAVRLSAEAPALLSRHNFATHFDRSIKGRNGEDLPRSIAAGGGAEIVTPPIFYEVHGAQDGRNLRVMLETDQAQKVKDLCACAAEVNRTCGLHIHLGRPRQGVSVWGPEHTRTMLAIGLHLEDTLYALCPASRVQSAYCKPIRACYRPDELGSFYPMGTVHPVKYRNPKRYCWLNVIETRRSNSPGTIEIRMLGNVRRYEYVFAWVKLWCKIGAMVAWLPSSLSMLHCCYSGALADELAAVRQAKARGGAESSETVDAARETRAFERDLQDTIDDAVHAIG